MKLKIIWKKPVFLWLQNRKEDLLKKVILNNKLKSIKFKKNKKRREFTCQLILNPISTFNHLVYCEN